MACTIDFRFLDAGFGGKTYKRKRQEALSLALSSSGNGETTTTGMDVDALPPPAKRAAIPSSENPDRPGGCGRPTYDGVIGGKVSGRRWKKARKQPASAKKVTLKGMPLEERQRQKMVKKAYSERLTALKEAVKRNKQEKRRMKEEREKRKQENILKSGTKLQVITNPNTLKKIAKSKDRKLLKVVPNEFLNRNKRNTSGSTSKEEH